MQFTVHYDIDEVACEALVLERDQPDKQITAPDVTGLLRKVAAYIRKRLNTEAIPEG